MDTPYQEPNGVEKVLIIKPSLLKRIKEKIKSLKPWQKWVYGVGTVSVITLASFSVYAYMRQTSMPTTPCGGTCLIPTIHKAATPTPTPSLTSSLLNGVLVETGKENIHPLAVMIENHPDARPQSGLGQADLVYEALAEGGITRFMAVFGDPTKAVRVGPVRSARTYYVDFATELNAFYAHVGGSEPALAQINRTGVLDLNQFAVGEPVYKRDFSRKVSLEHTMYSSTEKLWEYATTTKGWAKTATYKPWNFQDDAPAASRAASQTVAVSVSSAGFDVTWNYDPATNSYSRTMAGTVHKDANTGQAIQTKNIVLQTVAKKSLVEAGNKTIWEYTLTGTGAAVIIQNGKAIKGSWQKSGTERTRYIDENAKEISFVRGTTWVHLVHTDSDLSY